MRRWCGALIGAALALNINLNPVRMKRIAKSGLLALLAGLCATAALAKPPSCNEGYEKGPAADRAGLCRGYTERPGDYVELYQCIDKCTGMTEHQLSSPDYNRCTVACDPERQVGRAREDAWAAKWGNLEYLCSSDKSLRSNALYACKQRESGLSASPSKAPFTLTAVPSTAAEDKKRAAEAKKADAQYRQEQAAKAAKQKAAEEAAYKKAEDARRASCQKPSMRGACGCLKYQPTPPGGWKTCSR